MSRLLGKTACPSCNSSDANAIYDNDGVKSSYCFSCTKWVRSLDGTDSISFVDSGPKVTGLVAGGIYKPLANRGLQVETLEYYNYTVHETYSDSCDVHIAPYYNTDKKLVAQHLRFEGEKGNMPFRGEAKTDKLLFGQQKFSNSGKSLIICEGEIDVLSVYQAFKPSGKTAYHSVVGIPGAQTIEKAFKLNLEFIESFESVILFFDNDEPGREATQKALDILSFGKAKIIATFPEGCKDANDILVKHGAKMLRETVMYKAEEYKPEGVKAIKEIPFEVESFDVSLYPWESFNRKLFARRSGELTVYTSGTGMGKSTILRAIYGNLALQGEKCAMIMLEESVQETKADLMSSLTGKPIRKILAQLAVNKAMTAKGLEPLFPNVESISEETLKSAQQDVDDSGVILIDHSKGYDINSILSQIKFLAVSKGVRHILLDHITLLIASDAAIDNDVKSLDIVMKKLRIICEETGVSIDMISHIRKRGNGAKSVNGGAQIAVEELRGSGSLAQIANNIICFERDQQSEDSNVTVCRSLKSRMGGYTGIICNLKYDPETGHLHEYDEERTENSSYG